MSSNQITKIQVKCVSAMLTHDTQMFSNMDPYVYICCGHQSRKTKTHKQGGKRPRWNDQFTFNNPKENILNFTVMDQDTITDDKVGQGFLDINKFKNNPNIWNKENLRLLYKQRDAGTLCVQIMVAIAGNQGYQPNNIQGNTWGNVNNNQPQKQGFQGLQQGNNNNINPYGYVADINNNKNNIYAVNNNNNNNMNPYGNIGANNVNPNNNNTNPYVNPNPYGNTNPNSMSNNINLNNSNTMNNPINNLNNNNLQNNPLMNQLGFNLANQAFNQPKNNNDSTNIMGVLQMAVKNDMTNNNNSSTIQYPDLANYNPNTQMPIMNNNGWGMPQQPSQMNNNMGWGMQQQPMNNGWGMQQPPNMNRNNNGWGNVNNNMNNNTKGWGSGW